MATLAKHLTLALVAFVLLASPAAADSRAAKLAEVIQQIEALPYQPNYLPLGFDSAFGPAVVPNALPAQDYTSGSIPGSPDAPAWPSAFLPVLVQSADGGLLTGMMAL